MRHVVFDKKKVEANNCASMALFARQGTKYWDIGTYVDPAVTRLRAITYLEAHGYKCPPNASKKSAVDALRRFERGLMSYEQLSVEELQSFCKARGLSSKPTTVSRLARILEKADSSATFPRFVELAPEMRNMIYAYHIQSFYAISEQHRQPPITLASRQLRAEAKPLFYKLAVFYLALGKTTNVFDHLPAHTHASEVPDYLLPKKSLLYMPPVNFACITRLNFCWKCKNGEEVDIRVSAQFTTNASIDSSCQETSKQVNMTDVCLEDAIKKACKDKFGDIDNIGAPLNAKNQTLQITMIGSLVQRGYTGRLRIVSQ
jgi:hypothetical protein